MPHYPRKDSPYRYGWVYGPDGAPTKAKSLRVKDKRAAEAILREWERRVADPAYAAAQGVTLEEALAGLGKYLTALHSRLKRSRDTLDYHEDKAGPLLRVIGKDARLAQITPAILESYSNARHLEGVTEHTITKELRTLRYALRIAKLNGKYGGDLQAVFGRMESEYKPRDRALTPDEVYALIGLSSADVGAQVAFAVATSAEAKCIVSAQRPDVDPDGRYVLLRGTKREARWRTVPIVTPLQRRLLTYALANANGQEPFLFGGTEWGLISALRRLSARLGIAHVSPNDLRRTFAVNMREAGVPLELLPPMMGHVDSTMIERVYGRMTPEQLRGRLVAALNAIAGCSAGGANTAGSVRTEADRNVISLRKLEPTAGLEPATYGLRNQLVGGISLRIPPELVYVA